MGAEAQRWHELHQRRVQSYIARINHHKFIRSRKVSIPYRAYLDSKTQHVPPPFKAKLGPPPDDSPVLGELTPLPAHSVTLDYDSGRSEAEVREHLLLQQFFKTIDRLENPSSTPATPATRATTPRSTDSPRNSIRFFSRKQVRREKRPMLTFY